MLVFPKREEQEMALWEMLSVGFVASCALVGMVVLFARTEE